MELLLNLNTHNKVTWNGHYRSSLKDAEIAPRPVQQKIPIWVGLGSSLESAERADRLGTGLAIVILGGIPK